MASVGVAERISLSHLGLMQFPFNVVGMPVGGVIASNISVGIANHQTSAWLLWGRCVVILRLHVGGIRHLRSVDRTGQET